MNIRKNLLMLGVSVAMAGLVSQTVNAADATGTATALLITPIAIAQTTEMDFGTISGGVGAGTVVLDTGGGRTPGGDAQVIGAGAGAAAVFTITGEANTAYTLSSLAATTATLDDGAGGGAAITVDSFTVTVDGDEVVTGGSETRSIGATLNLNPGQAPGTYTTAPGDGGLPYIVTVNYN